MTQFTDFGLPAFIYESLEKMKIVTPTPIQTQSIPVALKGKDILASAQTGTGKTIAYLLPVIAQLADSSHGSALVLAPTRELADQIKNALLLLLGKREHKDIALLIGGAPIYKQFISLRSNPRFVIGTPGRIIDHLERRSLSLGDTKFLILDETDRMLDMGFSEDLERICQELPKERQTMMFSATMPANIIRLSQKYLNNPEHIKIGEVTSVAPKIDQKTIKASSSEKFPKLLEELESREGSVIIFVRTKIGAAELSDRLRRHEHRADAIHGDLKQRQRDEVIRNYRSQKSRILVATDIAARGLDIPHIMHVINYDLPQCPEDYIHRIGRTGRAGMEGHALSFVGPSESRKWQMIYQHVNHGKTSEQPQFNGARKRSGGGGGGDRRRRDNNGGTRSYEGGRGRRGSSEGGERRYGSSEGGERKRTFGDRPARANEGGERRSFGDRPARTNEGGERRTNSDRPARTNEGGERRSFGDRPAAGEGRERRTNSDRPARANEGGERKRTFGDRPARASEGGERRTYGERKQGPSEGGEKKRSLGDRGPRSSEGGERKRTFGDKPARAGEGGERKRTFGDKPARASEGGERKRTFGDKPARSTEGGETRRTYGDKRPAKDSGGKKREYISEGASNPHKNKGPSKSHGTSKPKEASTAIHD